MVLQVDTVASHPPVPKLITLQETKQKIPNYVVSLYCKNELTFS